MRYLFSADPKDVPGIVPLPQADMPERDEAGNPVREIIKEQLGDELKEEPI